MLFQQSKSSAFVPQPTVAHMFLLRTADTLDLYMSETKKFYEKIHEE